MPRACQAGFAVLPIGDRHSDDTISQAEEWIHQHCREDFRFEALAENLGMSPRNFIRRFKAATGLKPVEYLQKLRVRSARHYLEEGDATVEEIGDLVGYDDAPFRPIASDFRPVRVRDDRDDASASRRVLSGSGSTGRNVIFVDGVANEAAP